MKKLFILILFCAVFGYFYYSYKNRKGHVLKIGMMSGWPPFMSINKDGEMIGFDVDIVEELRKRIGKQIEIIDGGNLSALFFALENEKIDAIMSGLDVTKKRKDRYDHIVYVKKPITSVVCISSFPLGSFVDFLKQNPSVALESGVSWEPILDSYELKNKVYLSSVADMLLHLNTNKVDMMLVDEIQYRRMKNKLGNKFIFMVPIPADFIIDGLGIFFNKNSLIKSEIAKTIEQMEADGTIATLMKKWGLSE